MGRVILVVGWLAGVALVALAGEPDTKEAATKALEAFAGTWEIVAVRPAGATKDARRLVFRRDRTYAALGKDGKELWAGTFEIDPTTTPKVWDHRSHDARKAGRDVLGIYELDGDRLRVACVVGRWQGKEWAGRPRPRGFDPTQADVVIELTRAK